MLFNNMLKGRKRVEINVKLEDFKWQVKSIPIEKLYKCMGLPENYMDIINID